jgi:hypothetical protein
MRSFITCALHQTFRDGDKFKKGEMGGACSIHEKREMRTKL